MDNAIIPAPPGQTPLDVLPVYGGSGGDLPTATYQAAQHFKTIFGRNPSQIELDALAPAYVGSDRHFTNSASGNQAVAAYALQLTQTLGPPDQAPKVTALNNAALDIAQKQVDLQKAQLDAAISATKATAPSASSQSIFGILANTGASAAAPTDAPAPDNPPTAVLFIGAAVLLFFFGKRILRSL